MLIYDHVQRNKTKIFLITALFPLILSVLIYFTIYLAFYLEGDIITGLSVLERTNNMALIVIPIVFAAAFVWILISYFNQGKMLLDMAGARKISKDTHFAIYSVVEDVAIMAGLPVPQVYLIPEQSCNAFAAGVKPETAVLAMTEGIVKRLTKPQLEGVIAHEMAHIGNRDVALMIMIASGIGILTLAGNILIRTRSRARGKGALIPFLLGLVFLFYGLLIAPIIRMMLSRRQEYQADATAALITRDPEALAQALEAISSNSTIDAFKNQPYASQMCFLPAVLSSLFATHPPIEKRIAALRNMLR